MRAALVYPHQLYARHPALNDIGHIFVIEDPLYFTQYAFHRQKLMLHRASMKQFADAASKTHVVHYIDTSRLTSTTSIAAILVQAGISSVQWVELHDDWLHQRLTAALTQVGIAYEILLDPHCLTAKSDFDTFACGRKKLFFTEFYIEQRKRLKILVDAKEHPIGGQWSFDVDNRKKLPRDLALPKLMFPPENKYTQEARNYVAERFPHVPGNDLPCLYPTSHGDAQEWLDRFVQERLHQFGDYEDAIHPQEAFLFHSVLTPMLNIGLLSPQEVVDAALAALERVPLNSLEGFIRQVIGWREFILGVYERWGRRQRSRNFWKHTRPMPAACYTATTGIEPVDNVISRVLESGYCHHIERLMILGNFFLLCEIHPDEVYQWFMELFIDSYDWVMVPNVYGMSQHADGGLMTTKPYLSGSAYILKMSQYKKGSWCPIWDGLYWRFIEKHREFFSKNPRLSMMSSQLDRMGSKLDTHRQTANAFLAQLG